MILKNKICWAKNALFQKSSLDVFYILPLIWGVTGLHYTNRGKKEIGVFIFLALVVYFIKKDYRFFYEKIRTTPLLWILSMSLVYYIYLYVFLDNNKGNLRSLIFSFVLILILPKSIFNKRNIYFLVFLGSSFVIYYAVWNTYYLGLGRYWPMNVIPFSTYSAIICSTALILLFYEKNKWLKLLLMLSVLAC